jgi:hypothetical protein
MKLQGCAVVVLLALIMVGESLAQTLRVKADIPFEFIVNGSTLPAGQYTIQSFGSVDGRTLLVGSAGNHKSAIVNAIGVESKKMAGETKLMFHRYGDRYFLTQVWVAGSEHGQELPRTHRESELAKDYQNRFQEVDVVAALR